MNECAYYVISKAGGTPYAGAVAEKQKHLNDRWRALCQQLGITYKKAEETRYGLKLLEIQLKQLNTWMAEVETRLKEFAVAGSCVLTEIQKKVKEMKVNKQFRVAFNLSLRTSLRSQPFILKCACLARHQTFPCERFCTKARFTTERKGNS